MRVRLRFGKRGKVRWTSHRDVARMWDRAFRRTGLPVAYSGGFSPRPRVSFGLALPTGAESACEYLDVELASDEVDVASLPGRLSAALPTGVDVLAAAVVDDRADALQEAVTSCTWRLELLGAAEADVARLIAAALDADELVVTRERKGQPVTDDLRPAILSLAVSRVTETSRVPERSAGRVPERSAGCVPERSAGCVPERSRGCLVDCELATRSRGVRPSELVRALGPGLELGSVERMQQWIERDGARREPIPLTATDAPHAETRAS